MRPCIGITTSYDDGTQSLDRRYVAAVEQAGGTPLPLPMLATTTALHALMDLLDGLVIIGGPAVTEGLKDELPNELDPADPVRYTSDKKWIQQSWEAELPMLGICYGMQRLNALAGGTIYGDVEKEHPNALTHSQKRGGTTHQVQFDRSSRLYDVLEVEHLSVNTRHLQAVASLGDGFSAVATAPDGVIEAIEHKNGRIFGVQFHPERMGAPMQPLFRFLVHQASSIATSV